MLLSILVGSCDRAVDPRLQHVQTLMDKSPREALDSMDNIERSSLSESNRHLYDFLTIKVSDKAYVRHTSDSLISKVIEYESSHKSNGRYAEALYYGGRVHSDMGDYPTALQYYQDALTTIEQETPIDLDLKANITSQMGRLLTNLRLYEEAVPYIDTALEIDRQEKDTANLISDMQLLGGVYMKAEKYLEAESIFKKTLTIEPDISEPRASKSKMYIAEIKRKIGELDSALIYIRNIQDKVDPIVRNSALGYAAAIYHDNNIPDTAYMFANELIESGDKAYMDIGYSVMFSPGVRSLVKDDMLYDYLNDYQSLLESFYDENENQLVINQEALYNYQLHLREKEKTQNYNNRMKKLLTAMAFVVICLIAIVFMIQYRNKSNILKLRTALDNIEQLKFELENNKVAKSSTLFLENNTVSEVDDKKDKDLALTLKAETLRSRLQNELMDLYNRSSEISPVPEQLLDSKAYLRFQTLIEQGKVLKNDDRLWNEIEEEILKYSPKFRTNLNLLTMGNLSENDLHTALLIKMGIKPKNMTILTGRSNGAIISRRETLSVKILGKKMDAQVINAIIRML